MLGTTLDEGPPVPPGTENLPAKYRKAKALLRRTIQEASTLRASLSAAETTATAATVALARERTQRETAQLDYARVVGLLRAERDQARADLQDADARARQAQDAGTRAVNLATEARTARDDATREVETLRERLLASSVRVAEMEGELGVLRTSARRDAERVDDWKNRVAEAEQRSQELTRRVAELVAECAAASARAEESGTRANVVSAHAAAELEQMRWSLEIEKGKRGDPRHPRSRITTGSGYEGDADVDSGGRVEEGPRVAQLQVALAAVQAERDVAIRAAREQHHAIHVLEGALRDGGGRARGEIPVREPGERATTTTSETGRRHLGVVNQNQYRYASGEMERLGVETGASAGITAVKPRWRSAPTSPRKAGPATAPGVSRTMDGGGPGYATMEIRGDEGLGTSTTCWARPPRGDAPRQQQRRDSLAGELAAELEALREDLAVLTGGADQDPGDVDVDLHVEEEEGVLEAGRGREPMRPTPTMTMSMTSDMSAGFVALSRQVAALRSDVVHALQYQQHLPHHPQHSPPPTGRDDGVQSQRDELARALAHAKTQIENLLRAQAQLEAKKDKEHSTLVDVKAEVESVRAAAETERQKLVARISELEKAHREAQAESAAFQVESTALRASLAEADAQRATWREEMASMSELVASSDRALEEALGTLAARDDDLRRLRRDLDRAGADRDALFQREETLRTHLELQIQELRDVLSSRTAEHERIVKEMEGETQQRGEERDRVRVDLAELDQRRRETERERSELAAVVVELKKSEKEREKVLAETRGARDELQAELAKAKADLGRTRARVTSLKSQLSTSTGTTTTTTTTTAGTTTASTKRAAGLGGIRTPGRWVVAQPEGGDLGGDVEELATATATHALSPALSGPMRRQAALARLRGSQHERGPGVAGGPASVATIEVAPGDDDANDFTFARPAEPLARLLVDLVDRELGLLEDHLQVPPDGTKPNTNTRDANTRTSTSTSTSTDAPTATMSTMPRPHQHHQDYQDEDSSATVARWAAQVAHLREQASVVVRAERAWAARAEEAEHQVRHHEQELSRTVTALERATRAAERDGAAAARLTEAVAEAEREVGRLTAAQRVAETRHQDLSTRLDRAQEALQTSRAEAQSALATISQLEVDLKTKHNQHTQRQAQLEADLQIAREQAKVERDRLETERDAAEDKVTATETQWRTRVAEAEAGAEVALRQKLVDAETALAETRRDLQAGAKRHDALLGERDALVEERDVADRARSDLEGQLAVLRKQMDDVQRARDDAVAAQCEAEGEVTRLQTELKLDRDAARAAANAAHTTHAAQTSQISELTAARDELHLRLQETQSRFDALSAKLDAVRVEGTARDEELRTAQGELRTRDEELSALESRRVREMEAAVADIQDLQAQARRAEQAERGAREEVEREKVRRHAMKEKMTMELRELREEMTKAVEREKEHARATQADADSIRAKEMDTVAARLQQARADVARLTAALAERDATVVDLQGRVTDLQEHGQEIARQAQRETETARAAVEETVRQQNRQVARLEADLSAATTRVTQLTHELATTRTAHDQEAKEHGRVLAGVRAELDAAATAWRTAQAVATAAERESARMNAELERAQIHVKAAESARARSQTDVEDQRVRYEMQAAATQQILTGVETKLAQRTQDVRDLQDTVARVRCERDAVRAECATLGQERDRVTAAMEEERRRGQQQQRQWQEDARAAQEERDQLRARVASLEGSLRDARVDLEKAHVLVKQSKENDLPEVRKEVERLQRRMARMAGKLATSEKRAAELAAQADSAQAQLVATREKTAELKNIQNWSETLRTQLHVKDGEIARLRKDHARDVRKLEEMEELTQGMQRLREAVVDREAQAARLRSALRSEKAVAAKVPMLVDALHKMEIQYEATRPGRPHHHHLIQGGPGAGVVRDEDDPAETTRDVVGHREKQKEREAVGHRRHPLEGLTLGASPIPHRSPALFEGRGEAPHEMEATSTSILDLALDPTGTESVTVGGRYGSRVDDGTDAVASPRTPILSLSRHIPPFVARRYAGGAMVPAPTSTSTLTSTAPTTSTTSTPIAPGDVPTGGPVLPEGAVPQATLLSPGLPYTPSALAHVAPLVLHTPGGCTATATPEAPRSCPTGDGGGDGDGNGDAARESDARAHDEEPFANDNQEEEKRPRGVEGDPEAAAGEPERAGETRSGDQVARVRVGVRPPPPASAAAPPTHLLQPRRTRLGSGLGYRGARGSGGGRRVSPGRRPSRCSRSTGRHGTGRVRASRVCPGDCPCRSRRHPTERGAGAPRGGSQKGRRTSTWGWGW